MIVQKETDKEYMMDSSLRRQDKLAQEEGNTEVKCKKERLKIGHRWDTLERVCNQTHLKDTTRHEVGNRHIGISKQELKHSQTDS